MTDKAISHQQENGKRKTENFLTAVSRQQDYGKRKTLSHAREELRGNSSQSTGPLW